MNLYISDLHFGHENVIKFDNRPFANAEEMDDTMIKRWNDRVSSHDTVYIVGDLCCRSGREPEWYLRQLKGRKILIAGNHDGTIRSRKGASRYFEDIRDILEVNDEGKKIVLCHYPMVEWNGFFHGTYHIYGHIHNNTTNNAFKTMSLIENAYNAACCINNYTPVSFNELKKNHAAFVAPFLPASASDQTLLGSMSKP